jgi:hypothetical protein
MRNPGKATNAWLVESAASHGRHTLFGRAERLENDELFGHSETAQEDEHTGEVFTVGKVSLGYLYDMVVTDTWKTGLGLVVDSVALMPSEIRSEYGNRPLSWMGFLRVRI